VCHRNRKIMIRRNLKQKPVEMRRNVNDQVTTTESVLADEKSLQWEGFLEKLYFDVGVKSKET